ncbi:glycine-rich domain-containing protein 2 [Cynara cardunculus var. scolymus]|uniref:glycine-rich domain-containing protein 2 n=1 Tax=Cynara cardunculus var. scolymus TaxID=59895 RepID=UPI000D6244EB|nr:glycine-rich domain-containing protein 2 [Cynara cardunculus var. scolymus]
MSVSSPATRTLSEASEEEVMRLSLDLVAAAGQNIGFLRDVAESHSLHHTPVLNEAVRRYDELWMPMISDLTAESGKPPMILPPLDIEWVWFCHTLNPVVYRQYCESRFLKLIGKSAIFNQENRDYALERCREIWVAKYPSEPFENESDSGDLRNAKILQTDHLLGEVSKQRHLLTKFSKPYMLELVYLIAAKKRYKDFLFILQRHADSCSAFVPTSDILLMWITHKSYPTTYRMDVNEMEGSMEKVIESEESVNEKALEAMEQLWERAFDQPYEKSGCPAIGGGDDGLKPPPIHWEITEIDANIKYRTLLPRFLLEVNILVKPTPMMKTLQTNKSKEFLRFQLLRCHRDFKINSPVSSIPSNSWQKTVHLYCEFGTKGIVVELRRKGGVCIKGSKRIEYKTFMWNELLRAPSITLDGVIGGRARILASITPPAQAPYLLKCVPDRVTDDSGAMVSEVVLKMNQYRPQEGRWLSRTVLDHAGRECFVIRMRVGGGFWRRGANKPTAVKWEDRCVEVREGSWSYIAGSIGKAPEKVIATATPKTPSQGWHASWSFSTGHELFIRSGSSTTTGMSFDLKTSTSTESQVRLVGGRKMQYQHEENDDEQGFVTLIRFTEENPSGRATGLLNWKLSAVEFLPEEDAAFVLLLSTSILRSVTEMRREDVGSLLIRRRLKEAKHGAQDWGSVIVLDGSVNSAHVRPWYRNVKAVMAREGVDYVTKNYSAEECSDELYMQALFG